MFDIRYKPKKIKKRIPIQGDLRLISALSIIGEDSVIPNYIEVEEINDLTYNRLVEMEQAGFLKRESFIDSSDPDIILWSIIL